jgi:hypothetical protein
VEIGVDGGGQLGGNVQGKQRRVHLGDAILQFLFDHGDLLSQRSQPGSRRPRGIAAGPCPWPAGADRLPRLLEQEVEVSGPMRFGGRPPGPCEPCALDKDSLAGERLSWRISSWTDGRKGLLSTVANSRKMPST